LNGTQEKSLYSSISASSGVASADLAKIGKGRGTVLSLKLDKAADSVTGQTVLDPRGYMTELKTMKTITESEISDIKKARLLLKSVINTNPKHAPGWIVAARLEEIAGRLQSARKIILQGLENCPMNEEIWSEAATLHTSESAKIILTKGIMNLPGSVKLWIQAAQLEQDTLYKSRVLRKALEQNPKSIPLWKAIVDLASEKDARILLSHAVECCPHDIELWLALTKLENYENARKILNRAREAIPTEPQIWFIASKLEESQGNVKMAYKIIDRGFKSLLAHGVVIDREAWLKEAETSEKHKPKMISTCRALVKAVVELGIEDQDKKRTWVADAEECLKKNSVETARAIYQHALSVFPNKKRIWWKAAILEKEHSTNTELDKLLKSAVQYCPQAIALWLMAAKEKCLLKDFNAARLILAEAFRTCGQSEEIWIAAFKLEFETHEIGRARKLLSKARTHPESSSPRIWIKSAIVERQANDPTAQRRILQDGILKYSECWKLWIMLAQLEDEQGNTGDARHAFKSGIKICMDATVLWINYALFEENLGNDSKARAILGLGRQKNPTNDKICVEFIRFEIRRGNLLAAEVQLAKSLQQFPLSGLLWSQAISMAPRSQRKSKCTEALKRCNTDPNVLNAVAKLFWHEHKLCKTRSWLMRNIELHPDIGDTWALLYKFELQYGTIEQQTKLLKMCQTASPHHGDVWCSVSKDPKHSFLSIEQILKKITSTQSKSMLNCT
jgi:pre-mRNA-processing factor 6